MGPVFRPCLLRAVATAPVSRSWAPPIRRAIGEIARFPTTTLELTGLDEGDIAQYVDTLAPEEISDEVASAIAQRSGGNPFFIGEIVRVLVAEGGLGDERRAHAVLPRSVREA